MGLDTGRAGRAAPGSPGGDAPGELRRVVVLGITGSGKSTLAARLAQLIGTDHVDLDSFNHGPQWTQVSVDQFTRQVVERADGDRWVFDGNYIDRVSHTLWPRADTIVWLDVLLVVSLTRLVRRTATRIVRGTVLWNGNRERWSALFGRKSLLVWAVQSHRRHRRELPGRLTDLAG